MIGYRTLSNFESIPEDYSSILIQEIYDYQRNHRRHRDIFAVSWIALTEFGPHSVLWWIKELSDRSL